MKIVIVFCLFVFFFFVIPPSIHIINDRQDPQYTIIRQWTGLKKKKKKKKKKNNHKANKATALERSVLILLVPNHHF